MFIIKKHSKYEKSYMELKGIILNNMVLRRFMT